MEQHANKPKNPFRKDTLAWQLMEGDWEDLTVPQIAEVLAADVETVRTTIHRVKKEASYTVPYKKRPKGQRASELYVYRHMQG